MAINAPRGGGVRRRVGAWLASGILLGAGLTQMSQYLEPKIAALFHHDTASVSGNLLLDSSGFHADFDGRATFQSTQKVVALSVHAGEVLVADGNAFTLAGPSGEIATCGPGPQSTSCAFAWAASTDETAYVTVPTQKELSAAGFDGAPPPTLDLDLRIYPGGDAAQTFLSRCATPLQCTNGRSNGPLAYAVARDGTLLNPRGSPLRQNPGFIGSGSGATAKRPSTTSTPRATAPAARPTATPTAAPVATPAPAPAQPAPTRPPAPPPPPPVVWLTDASLTARDLNGAVSVHAGEVLVVYGAEWSVPGLTSCTGTAAQPCVLYWATSRNTAVSVRGSSIRFSIATNSTLVEAYDLFCLGPTFKSWNSYALQDGRFVHTVPFRYNPGITTVD